jgi:Polyketide cyclase / dehydrase and lipid transport
MAATTVTDQYKATPAAAWALMGDFAGIGKVFDGVTDVVVADDVRTFTLMGMRMSERLIARDEAGRTLSYAIIDGVPGIVSHEATVVVSEHADGCEIAWTVASDPEEAQPIFADAYRGALQQLHGALDEA